MLAGLEMKNTIDVHGREGKHVMSQKKRKLLNFMFSWIGP